MSRKRVLLVDDEEFVLYGLERALRGGDFAVRSVTSGEAALEAMKGCFFDLCFLDIRMPGMGGTEVLRWIRQSSPETRVAVMSASHMETAERDLIRSWADYFLEKPLDLSGSRDVVRESLGS